MSEEVKYPVYYAVQRMEHYSKFEGFLLIGFIVSKCWVINVVKNYSKNGDSEIIYKVFFPYSYCSIYNGLKTFNKDGTVMLIPSENETSTVRLTNIYTSYEEAKKEADWQNSKMCVSELALIPTLDIKKNENRQKELDENLEECRKCEEFIFELTKSIPIKPDDEMNVDIRPYTRSYPCNVARIKRNSKGERR